MPAGHEGGRQRLRAARGHHAVLDAEALGVAPLKAVALAADAVAEHLAAVHHARHRVDLRLADPVHPRLPSPAPRAAPPRPPVAIQKPFSRASRSTVSSASTSTDSGTSSPAPMSCPVKMSQDPSSAAPSRSPLA